MRTRNQTNRRNAGFARQPNMPRTDKIYRVALVAIAGTASGTAQLTAANFGLPTNQAVKVHTLRVRVGLNGNAPPTMFNAFFDKEGAGQSYPRVATPGGPEIQILVPIPRSNDFITYSGSDVVANVSHDTGTASNAGGLYTIELWASALPVQL